MSSRVVLVTGVSRYLGGRLAARLAVDPRVERVVGVDAEPPADVLPAGGRTEFVRADIRNPLIAKVIAQAGVDTVVHLSVTATPIRAGGRSSMKEMNVIGTMQLLAACQQAPSMRKLVVKSSTAVYGASPRDPALFTEDDEPGAVPRSGFGKDSVEIEGYVRGFARRRPDVDVSVLRLATLVGAHVDNPLTRYLALPVVPTVFGHDPRLQLLHEDDALEVLQRATLEDRPGLFNVAGPGVLLLSQAVRRAGRAPVPVPSPAVNLLGRLTRQAGLVDFTPDQMRYLYYGRAVDVDRLITEFGYRPHYTTVAAFDDFVRARNLRSPINPATLAGAEDVVLDRLLGRAGRRAAEHG